MRRASLLGLALVWLVTGAAAWAGDLPRVVLLREGAGPARATSRIPAAPRTDVSRTGSGSTRARLDFPHDLYLPGARRNLGPVAPREDGPREGITQAAAAGPLRLAIFRVDFLEDSAGSRTTGDGRFDLRTGVLGIPVDPPPHDPDYIASHAEALHRYYAAQSYGALDIQTTIFPADPQTAYHLTDMADYGPWAVSQAEDVLRAAEKIITDCVRAAEATHEVDFRTFDAFVVVHAGADFQGDINGDSEFDIPSFTLTFGESLLVYAGEADSARIGRVLILPESTSQDGRVAALNGVFAHEFGHILGLPDLYNIFNGVPQVGYWSLMDSGENIPAIVVDPVTLEEFEVDGILPTSLDPWSKLQIFPETMQLLPVEESWEGPREAVETSAEVVFIGIDDHEYFLVENRALDLDGSEFPFVQQDSTTGVILGPVDAPPEYGLPPGGHLEYDAVLPGGGILIWHIDDSILTTAYLFTGGVNFETGYRGVAVVEADGISDQGRFNLGVPQDLFCDPGPGDLCYNRFFGPGTIPNSAANDGAWTGITVEVQSPTGPSMDVAVTRPQARAGWPVPVARRSDLFVTLGTSVPVDLDGSGTPELAFQVTLEPEGETNPRRGVAALHPDGSGYESPTVPDPAHPDSRFAVVTNPLLPGLTASSAFEISPGTTAGVVAAADNTGRPYLWTGEGTPSLLTASPPAVTVPPVLIDRPSGADWVLVAGVGAVYALTVPGTVAFTETSQLAPGARAVVGPCVLPGERCVDTYIAAGFEGGVVEIFEVPGPNAPPCLGSWRGRAFGSAIRSLAGGHLGTGAESEPLLAVLTEDSLAVASLRTGVLAAWALPRDETISLPLAVGDVDGDGFSEIVAATDQGSLLVYNGDGSTALGWPRHVAAPVRDVTLIDADGDGALDLLALDGAGRLHGLDRSGRSLPDFPRAAGAHVIESAAVVDLDGDGRLTWTATHDDSLLAIRLPGAARLAGDWPLRGGRPEGGSFQPVPSQATPVAGIPDLGPQGLMVHPNPARGDGVEIRFSLKEGETAEVSLLDPTGSPLSDAQIIDRGTREGENAVRWQLAGVAPGLYFCRLERHSGSGSRVDLAKIVVLR